MDELPRQPDPRKTLLRAAGILVMLAIAAFGMIYTAVFIMRGMK
jgi:hypothetical protein